MKKEANVPRVTWNDTAKRLTDEVVGRLEHKGVSLESESELDSLARRKIEREIRLALIERRTEFDKRSAMALKEAGLKEEASKFKEVCEFHNESDVNRLRESPLPKITEKLDKAIKEGREDVLKADLNLERLKGERLEIERKKNLANERLKQVLKETDEVGVKLTEILGDAQALESYDRGLRGEVRRRIDAIKEKAEVMKYADSVAKWGKKWKDDYEEAVSAYNEATESLEKLEEEGKEQQERLRRALELSRPEIGHIIAIETERMLPKEALEIEEAEELMEPTEKERVDRYYHWWQEPEGSLLRIDKEFMTKVIKNKIRETGARSIHDLMINNMKSPQSEYSNCMTHLRERERLIRVRTLKQFCDRFEIDYRKIEKEKVSLDRPLPIKLDSTEFRRLFTHMTNEGSLEYIKRTDSCLPRYSNQDPVLHWHFKQQIERVGGKFYGPDVGHGEIVSRTDATTGRVLHKAGIPYGDKTINQPSLSELLKNEEAMKYHIQATLAEECYLSLRVKRDGYLERGIRLRRFNDITDFLPEDFVSGLKPEQEFRVKKIEDENIKRIIYEHPPRVLTEEWVSLVKQGSTEIPVKFWNALSPQHIHKSRNGRVTSCWEFATTRSDVIDLIHDQYGVLPRTWKEKVFEEYYKLGKKLRGRKLTKSDMEEVKRVKKKFSGGVPKEWIVAKMKELFPKADWVKDPKELNKVLFRRRKRRES